MCIVSCSRREKTWQLVWEDDFNRKDIFSYKEYKDVLSETDIIVSQKRHYYIETILN